MIMCAKCWESILNVQKLINGNKAWESMRRCAKCVKVWQSTRKCAESWESVLNVEKVIFHSCT